MTARQFTPHTYQQSIIDHILEHERCAVWAGMGMGKTVSAMTILDAVRFVDDAPALVLAPTRVANTTWPDEARKWAHTEHLRIQPVTGAMKERVAAINKPADVYTCNYENLPWLVEYWGDRWPYRTVIADESTKLKSFRLRQGGKRAQALARVAHTKVKRFIELTGTPSPNGLQDLYGQMWFIDRGQRLGRTYEGFKQRWFAPHPNGCGGVVALPHAQKEIQGLLSDICITVEAKDWFDLREPIVNNIYLELPARARKTYEDMEKRMFMELDSGHEIEAFNAASRTIKCLQIANGAAYTEGNSEWQELHDIKVQALESVVEEANGMPVLVAYHFKSDLERLKKHFPKGRELDKNPKTLVDWNAGRIPLLFAHPQSAGHGLNLQDGGNILVFFAHWWNLEERMQVIERIGPTRQLQAGHDRPMWIHNLIARSTVDEMVIERVDTKREVQDILMAAMKLRKTKGETV